jgi:microcystin-dependent protein
MASSEPYIGSIALFAGNFAPRGYALCAGQLLPIAQNTALFSILGTYYGGNGTTTFALPDLRGRAPIGTGNGPGLSNITLGEVAGNESVTMQQSNMPPHNHTIGVDGNTVDSFTPANKIPGSSGFGNANLYSSATPNATFNPAAVSIAGQGQPLAIRNPFLGINYIIALQGIFPSRN